MKTFLTKGLNILTLFSLVFASYFAGPVRNAVAEEIIPEPVTCPALGPIDLKVESNGEKLIVELPAGQYKLTASGTYVYRPTDMPADAAFSLRKENDNLPAENYFEDTLWYQGDSGHLGIKVNNQNPKDIWGSVFNENHEYTYILNHGGGEIAFQITDDQYNDNIGFLTVKIECYEEVAVEPVCLEPMMSLGEKDGMVKVSKINPRWIKSIPGSSAEWVWTYDPLSIEDRQNGSIGTFTEIFTIVGNPVDSTIKISADNTYSVKVNGTEIVSLLPMSPVPTAYTAVHEHVIPASLLVSGENIIEITVQNQAMPGTGKDGNPAGLIYDLHINIDGCEEEEVEVPVDPEIPCEQTEEDCGDTTPTCEQDTESCVTPCEGDCDGSGDNDNDDENGDNNSDGDSEQGGGNEEVVNNDPPQVSRTSGGRASLAAPEVAGAFDGEVLGECVAFEKYHRKGDKNGEVARIQEFLNEYMNAGLKVDGVYGNATVKAVHVFQDKYFDHVIKPWTPPLSPKTTGRWYKTTRMMANELINCPESKVFLEDPKIEYKIER